MIYGLIGGKLGHSFSREIHAKIADYPYTLLELAASELEDFLMRRDFEAINVTIPYKQAVLPYLDCIDDAARRIGAVNTIVKRGGKLYGYNTDYSGAEALIRHAGVEIDGRRVMILGSGGTSRTLHAVAEGMGAAEIITVSRHPSESKSISYEQVDSVCRDTEVILNATPVGMYPDITGCPLKIDKTRFPRLSGVIDVIYNPLRTPLIRQALALGIPAEGGLYMLAAQAAYASALFRGVSVDTGSIERVFEAVLSEKQNIVLIGMPSSGKSTVGACLSERTGKRFVDSDLEIVRQAGASIPEIFAERGEAGFRELEREVIAGLSGEQGILLATGGGAVLDPVNVDHLRANGRLFFLDRPLELLTPTQDRPLACDREALERRYRERYPLYVASADVTVPGDGTPEEVACRIWKS